MGNNRPPFEPDTVFHVYNHGNADDNIFREDENYRYFLKRYAYYIYPVARTYAFCLLPNHFHLMVKVRSWEELLKFFKPKNPEGLSISNKVAHRFGTLLNAYTKSYNKYYNRQGSLFRNTTKRKPVRNDSYYNRLIYYIHQNPVRHGFVGDPSEWLFSSYPVFLSRKNTKLERQEVLDWFGGRKAFADFHDQSRVIKADEFY